MDEGAAARVWFEEQENDVPTIKKCPECLAEIPIGARKCQFCASKQKGDYSWLMAIVIIIGLGLVFSSLGSDSSNEAAKEESPLCASISSLHIVQANKKLGATPTATVVKTVFERTAISDEKNGLYAYYEIKDGKYVEVVYLTGIATICSKISKAGFEKAVVAAKAN